VVVDGTLQSVVAVARAAVQELELAALAAHLVEAITLV
jgi:hypothetical protein